MKAGTYFISHSYHDQGAVNNLLENIPEGVKPRLFPPIEVTPEQMVSTILIEALLHCDGLIYLKGGQSDKSFWVSFERNYAMLSGKNIFSYDTNTGEIAEDKSQPFKPPVFPSYAAETDNGLNDIFRFLKYKRYFDLFIDKEDLDIGANIASTVSQQLKNRLDAGGYVVLFLSMNAVKSIWVKKEIEMAKAHPNSSNRLLIALLDEGAYENMNFRYPNLIDSIQYIKLYQEGRTIMRNREMDPRETSTKIILPTGLDQNRLDDLIVRIYWLTMKNKEGSGLH